MKTIKILMLLILIGPIAGFKYKHDPFKVREVSEIASNLFVSKYEVSNSQWLSYLLDVKGQFGANSNEYKSALPDTTVWIPSIASTYLRHPAYANYPVVGISYEQALQFCKWNEEKKRKNCEIGSNVSCRLLKSCEWDIIANIPMSKANKRNLSSNLIHAKSSEINENTVPTTDIYAYIPNDKGLYNVIGNVSEMTLEKGISRGGNFSAEERNDILKVSFPYTKPEKWLGLRVVYEKSLR